MHQQVTLINLPEFDWPLGHVNGASLDQPGVRTLMQGFDQDLASLEDTYRKAGVLGQTLFVLTADHGFTTVSHKVSHNVVNKAVTAAGTSIIRDTYHTAGYVWVRDKSKSPQVAANIAGERNPYIESVYYKVWTKTGTIYLSPRGANRFRAAGVEAANQYLLGTFNGPNGPDVVVIMKEHAMLVAGAESSWKGDHGGAAWNSQHLPLILSGPGVRKGYVSSFPAPLVDIAPTVLSLLNVPSTGMQGSVLADAVTASTAAQKSTQTARGRTLWPVILSLKAESHLETRAGQ
jgi:arylsulfatase A-like enzyme